jgi:N-methylhydantoinase A
MSRPAEFFFSRQKPTTVDAVLAAAGVISVKLQADRIDMADYSIAVDIGGTFTDVVLRHADGRFWVDKTLTTSGNLKLGFFGAIDSVIKLAGVRPEMIDDVVVHATTVVTNAIIERKAPKVALIVTEGFRDVLTIRDECRSDIFDNQLEVPEPLIPFELTFGVAERLRADGTILKAVDRSSVEAVALQLREAGVKSIAVCLLNSYKNAANEQAVRAILNELVPDALISLSSEVAPQMREYPRASTTALNAYTIPIVKPYLEALQGGLQEAGFKQDLLIMLSSGGVIGAEVAAVNPVRMIESGPAAGALAASYYAKLLDLDALLSFDMGGTTAKACFIQNGSALVTGSFEVDRIYRFQQGSGLPVTLPCIDMIEIGAGGGSIAYRDQLNLLAVGPQSAGSSPGPVCYGRGGTRPTVTDADLCLGLLDAERFLGGEMGLDEAGSRQALSALGRELGITEEQTALGIYELVGESMAAAVRAHATERGVDWRGTPLLAFGGAGPVHACYVAELLDSHTVIYPPMASVLSAFGTLVTPVRLDLVRSDLNVLGHVNWDVAHAQIGAMLAEARSALTKAGCPPEKLTISIAADMRYSGQHNELTVLFPQEVVDGRNETEMRRLFEATYEQNYGVRLDELGVEFVAWRVSAHGPEQEQTEIQPNQAIVSVRKPRRTVRFPSGPEEVPVYSRAQLKRGQQLRGPLIIEERETTIVILPGWNAEIDRNGCVYAAREGFGYGQRSSARALEQSY